MTPAARREAVARLRQAFEMSERRAIRVIGTDRSSIRYRSTRPGDAPLRVCATLNGDDGGAPRLIRALDALLGVGELPPHLIRIRAAGVGEGIFQGAKEGLRA